MELSIHGFFWAFAWINSALRKLPRMFTYSFSPKNLVFVIRNHNGDVRPKAVFVQHTPSNISIHRDCHTRCAIGITSALSNEV